MRVQARHDGHRGRGRQSERPSSHSRLPRVPQVSLSLAAACPPPSFAHHAGQDTVRLVEVAKNSDRSANIYRFLECVATWLVPEAVRPTRSLEDADHNHDQDKDQDARASARVECGARLHHLWEAFDEPYGHEVSLHLPTTPGSPPSTTAQPQPVGFVPTLSAVRVFARKLQSDGDSNNKPEVEWFEWELPHNRAPLVERVEELGEDNAWLTDGTTADIDLARSWFSVVWTPILNCRHMTRVLAGSFLTYHNFVLDAHPYDHLLGCPESSGGDSDSQSLVSFSSSSASSVWSAHQPSDIARPSPTALCPQLLGFVPSGIRSSTWFASHAPVEARLPAPHSPFYSYHYTPKPVPAARRSLDVPVNLIRPAVEMLHWHQCGHQHHDFVHAQRTCRAGDPLASVLVC